MTQTHDNKVHSRRRVSHGATIKARDENGELKIKISFSSDVLTREEINTVTIHATRLLSSALAGLPFTDYGIDNTVVTL